MNAKQVVNKLVEGPDDVDAEAYVADLPDRRKVVVQVAFTFDQPIENVNQLTHNLRFALERSVQEIGLAPEDEDAALQHIDVQAVQPSGRCYTIYVA